jgi:hypothetical protein
VEGQVVTDSWTEALPELGSANVSRLDRSRSNFPTADRQGVGTNEGEGMPTATDPRLLRASEVAALLGVTSERFVNSFRVASLLRSGSARTAGTASAPRTSSG